MTRGNPTIVDEHATNPPRPRRTWRLVKDLGVSVAVALVVILVMQWVQRESQRGGGGALPVGQPAPAFALTEMHDREMVRSEELGGQTVILSFWATWCGPCVSELPDLARLRAEQGDRLRLLTITDEPPSIVKPFLERRGLELEVLYDPGGQVASRYRVTRLPTTVIIDSAGRVVHDFSGVADVDILRDHVAALDR